jgi:hypothetical protein
MIDTTERDKPTDSVARMALSPAFVACSCTSAAMHMRLKKRLKSAKLMRTLAVARDRGVVGDVGKELGTTNSDDDDDDDEDDVSASFVVSIDSGRDDDDSAMVAAGNATATATAAAEGAGAGKASPPSPARSVTTFSRVSLKCEDVARVSGTGGPLTVDRVFKGDAKCGSSLPTTSSSSSTGGIMRSSVASVGVCDEVAY